MYHITQIYCTAHVHVRAASLYSLLSLCSVAPGRVYRPRDCERLIVYLKGINLPKPDKWGTSQLISFLQQVRYRVAGS